MAKSVAFMQYMRAHGNTPGPTQRPILAGAITALIADIPAVGMLWWSGALSSATQSLSLETWMTLVLYSTAMILGGAIYGRVFSRAANDIRGGWLFGISYGFLLWMVGPVTVLQWLLDRPIALGVAAMGILGAHLAYGLVLGLLFPSVHRLLQYELRDLPGQAVMKCEQFERRGMHNLKYGTAQRKALTIGKPLLTTALVVGGLAALTRLVIKVKREASAI